MAHGERGRLISAHGQIFEAFVFGAGPQTAAAKKTRLLLAIR